MRLAPALVAARVKQEALAHHGPTPHNQHAQFRPQQLNILDFRVIRNDRQRIEILFFLFRLLIQRNVNRRHHDKTHEDQDRQSNNEDLPQNPAALL